jgi:diguanylate cyclase
MALASYALWTGLALIGWAGGLIQLPNWLLAATLGGIVVSNAWFWYMLRSGRNLLRHDPSMTFPQVALALVWVLVVIGGSHTDRSLMMVVYVVVMLFGIFRLDRSDFLKLSALAVVGYAAVVAWDLAVRAVEVNLFHEVLRFLVLTSCLLWCSFFGTHVAQLRAKLRQRNEELQRAVKDFRRTADRDHLTWAYNRHYIMKVLETERARSDRRHAPFAIVIFDLDHFKSINDRYGHIAGDRVLTKFSEIARRELRSIDVVSSGRRANSFGRFGGEEFIAVLPETGLDGARRCAERLRTAVAAEQFEGGVRVTFSAGDRGLPLRRVDRRDAASRRRCALSRQELGPRPGLRGEALAQVSQEGQGGGHRLGLALSPWRAALLADAELAEDPGEQVVGGELSGDLRQRAVGQAQLLRRQFHALALRQQPTGRGDA